MPTKGQSDYYARIRKLTPEQREEAYLTYTDPTLWPRGRKPPISTLATKYNISNSSMFRILHEMAYLHGVELQ